MLDGLFINSSSVTGTPIRLNNNQFLRSRNAANTGDINVLKVNASNQIEFSIVPIVTGLGSLALLSDITNYGPQIAALQSDVISLQTSVGLLETSVATLQSEVGSLQAEVISLSLSISTIEADVASLQGLQSSYLLLDGTRSMTGALNMASHKIINLTNPTDPQDAATKAYADSLISDITDLENRVAVLEADVITINTEITSLQDSIDFLQSDVNIINSQIVTIQSNIVTINADITALEAQDLTFLKLDGSRAMTGILNMNSHRISGVSLPVNGTDAVNKDYVLSVVPDITALEARVTVLEADVGALQTDVSFIQGQIITINIAVSDLQADVVALEGLQSSYLLLDGTRAMTGILNLDSHKIINLTDPTDPQDAATKAYADSLVAAPVTASNLGAGEGVFAQKVAADLQFKSIVAGSNISLASDADTITINSTGSGIAGVDVLLYETPVLSDATIMSFGFGFKVNPSSTVTGRVNIDLLDNPPVGWTASGVNNGGGVGVYKNSFGNTLYFKTLVAGSNVTISDLPDDTISISANAGISSIDVSKDGVPVIATTTLNFLGSNITVTNNGGVADISVTSGGGSTVDYIQFNLTPTGVPTTPGVLFWDQAQGNETLSLNMAGPNGVVQQIGEEFYVRVKAISAISEGQTVMIVGTVGTSGVYEAAPAAGVTDGHVILGVATEDIAFNDFGYVTEMGLVRGLITDGTVYGEVWNDGDELFWNPNPLYPGGLTNVKPSAPNVKASIGSVVKASNGMSGSIYVRLDPGSELGGTDSNVQFGTLAPGDFISYDMINGYWTNITVENVRSALGVYPLAIQDQSTPVTSQTESINFMGDGVMATAIGNDVTVHVPGASFTKYIYTVPFPIVIDTNISLPSTPKNNSLVVYIVSGPMMTEGILDDYFITSGTSTLTLLASSLLVQALGAGDRIVIQYCV